MKSNEAPLPESYSGKKVGHFNAPSKIPAFLVEKDLEEAVLGTLVRYPELLEKAIEWADSDPFFIPLHRQVWEVLREEAIFSPPEHSLSLKAALKAKVPELEESRIAVWEEKADPDLIPEALIYLLDLDARRRTYIALEEGLKGILRGEIPEAILDRIRRSAESLYTPFKQDLQEAYQRALRLLEGGRRLPTGFADLDSRLVGGIPKGGMTVLGARPSVGKTSFARRVARNVLLKGGRVYWASFDQSSEQILLMEAALKAGVPYAFMEDIPGGRSRLEEALWALVDLFNGKLIMDDHVVSAKTLALRIRRAHRLTPIDLVVVDYLQFLPSDTHRSDLERVSETSRVLKKLAIELDVAVLALAQLSRNVEYRAEKQPLLADLRDSGQIEQDADLVLALHRETTVRGPEAIPAKVLVLKNKVGPTGEVSLYWDPSYAEYCQEEELENGKLPGGRYEI